MWDTSLYKLEYLNIFDEFKNELIHGVLIVYSFSHCHKLKTNQQSEHFMYRFLIQLGEIEYK